MGSSPTNGDLILSGSINGMLTLDSSFNNVIGGRNAFVDTGVGRATISGGGHPLGRNVVTDSGGTIGGGIGNRAGNDTGTGTDAEFATVGGGSGNTAGTRAATVSGGEGNTAGGEASAVGGGGSNVATADYGSIGCGANNSVGGRFGTDPGGQGNRADGQSSLAAGQGAKAVHDGAFVWGDTAEAVAVLSSTAPNQFIARATGGIQFITNGGHSAGVSLAPGASAWSAISDRSSKENFGRVEGADLLQRVNAIPILTWNWRSQDPSVRHIGPVAQDFHAAFTVGEDDRHISTVDADGVALAAAQALYRLSLQKDKEIRELSRKVRELPKDRRPSQRKRVGDGGSGSDLWLLMESPSLTAEGSSRRAAPGSVGRSAVGPRPK
jgi:hypothetical protein